MKLIAFLTLDDYQDILKNILQQHKIPVFSQLPVKGYRIQETNLGASWFSGNSNIEYAVLNFSFLEEAQASKLMNAIKAVNEKSDLERPIHAYQLNVEKVV